jgi:hypothetical protein
VQVAGERYILAFLVKRSINLQALVRAAALCRKWHFFSVSESIGIFTRAHSFALGKKAVFNIYKKVIYIPMPPPEGEEFHSVAIT